MTYFEGTSLNAVRSSLRPDQSAFVDAQLAGFLRQMHAITNPTFGLQAPQAPKHTRWRDAFVGLFEGALSDGEAADVVPPVSFEVLRSIVQSNADVLDHVSTACFVHWDLWDTNVFIDPTTCEVTGIIDFERSLWGDPLMEGQFFAKAGDAGFMDAYGRNLLGEERARIRRLLYDLYLFVVMLVEVSYRHYPTDVIETFARSHLTQTLAKLGLDVETAGDIHGVEAFGQKLNSSSTHRA